MNAISGALIRLIRIAGVVFLLGAVNALLTEPKKQPQPAPACVYYDSNENGFTAGQWRQCEEERRS